MNDRNRNARDECVRKWRDDNHCTLNGKPAKIVGWKCDFPMVAELDGPLSVEYAWATVDNVMTNNDRRFKAD